MGRLNITPPTVDASVNREVDGCRRRGRRASAINTAGNSRIGNRHLYRAGTRYGCLRYRGSHKGSVGPGRGHFRAIERDKGARAELGTGDHKIECRTSGSGTVR